MLAAGTFVEIRGVRAVQAADAFHLVLHGVAVDHVHDHGDTGLMGRIDQRLELFGRAETAAQRKEIRHLIAKASVIGMLLQGHDLQCIITRFNDTGKHLFAEFGE